MADKVDVLAVMAAAHDGRLTTANNELWQARAAVAELVAANKAVIAALSAPGAPTKTERDEMIALLSAALATLGGSR